MILGDVLLIEVLGLTYHPTVSPYPLSASLYHREFEGQRERQDMEDESLAHGRIGKTQVPFYQCLAAPSHSAASRYFNLKYSCKGTPSTDFTAFYPTTSMIFIRANTSINMPKVYVVYRTEATRMQAIIMK